MTTGFWTGYVERLVLVAIALAVIYLLARRLRTARFFSRDARHLDVLETTPLSQHVALHVVRAGSRHFLIGSAAGGVSTLAELEAPLECSSTRAAV